MKFYGATKRSGVVAVRRRATVAVTISAATFALMFAVVMAGTSQAQDASKDAIKGDSSWERVDSVLVLPPVYRAKDKSEPADACAEDCPNLSDPGIGESPTAVAGTADDPSNASAGTADDPAANQQDEASAVDGSTPGESGTQEQQPAAGADQESADSLNPSIGSTQDYQEQQQAQELGNYGIVQAPTVIVGAPGLYYLPGTSVPAASGFAPTRSLPSSPAWMPQPMPRVVPLPSIVPSGVPRTVGGFPGGFAGGFHGGFAGGLHGGFSPGFHGGFGHR
jgi:hypothetical protein